MYLKHLVLHTPPGFDFQRTANSHGWIDLLPFSASEDFRAFTRILHLDDGTVISTRLTDSRNGIRVTVSSARPLTAVQRHTIIGQLSSCLRLDEDFSEFHATARRYPAFRWIATTGSGRLLRAPTVFEDVVKMICTTNCSWSLTKIMTRNLVEAFGKEFTNGQRAFPTPDAIAASSEAFLRKNIRAGYRSPYLLELTEQVAAGKLNLEAWRSSPLSTEDLFKQMRAVKGIGPYAAGNLMKLVGHYDYLGLDSWVRAQYYTLHCNGRRVKDATIEKHYEPYGKYRGLFFWLEMTRYWHDQKFSSPLTESR